MSRIYGYITVQRFVIRREFEAYNSKHLIFFNKIKCFANDCMVNKLRGAYQTMCEELSSNGHSQIEKKNNRAFYRIPDLKVNHEHELQDVSTREFLSIEVIWTIPLQQASQHYYRKVCLLS